MNRPLTPRATPSSKISLQDSLKSCYLLNSDGRPLGGASAESIEKGLIVGFLGKRGLSCGASVHDVIHRLWKLNSQWTGHG